MSDQPDDDDRVPDDEPSPQSKVEAALKGLAVCVCLLVATVGIGMHSLCGPHGAIGYGGGDSTAGVVVLICLLVIVASVVGLFVYFVLLLIALGNR